MKKNGGGLQPGQEKRPEKGTVCFICRVVFGKKASIRKEGDVWRHRDNCLEAKLLKKVSPLDKEIEGLVGLRHTKQASLLRLGS